MKKEIIVGCFLILMLIVSFVNIHFLNKLTDNVIQFIEESEKGAEQNDWDIAVKKGEAAAKLWSDSETYIHLVLRHAEIETTTDAIFGYMAQIYAREEGNASGAAQAAISRLKSISAIEKVKLGSVF
ncbi:MAG: DUF4363 family protein [Clostridiales bacterium]|nr:DUF4363 family protein [Clostridiales bacterium]